MHFISVLRASLVVVVAFMVCSSDATIPYFNGATFFGRCANFSIQGGTTVAFNGVLTTVTNGNVGVAPGTSITGASALGAGYSLQASSSSAISCAADVLIAYANLKGITCTNTLPNSDLSGLTLYAGVYCTGSGFLTLTATILYLDARGDANAVFIFHTSTTLITSTNTMIVLINGALAKNVYWQVGSSATLGATSSFVGQMTAYGSISVSSTVTVVGRLYAQAAVTFAGNDKICLPSQY